MTVGLHLPVADASAGLEAIDVGQADVEEYQIGYSGGNQLQGIGGVLHREHVVALCLQPGARGERLVRAIVHHQDARRSGHGTDCVTASIVVISAARSIGLVRNASQPLARARSSVSARASAVMAMIGMAWVSTRLRIWAATVKPSMPGSCRSSRTI